MEGSGRIEDCDTGFCGSPTVVQIIQKVHTWM